MGSLEEIIKASDKPKSVAKYFGLFSKSLLEDEEVERIEIDESLSPKAMIFTNKRVVQCKSKSFGTELEISFYIFWDSVAALNVNYASMGMDYIFQIGNSNINITCDNYSKKTWESAFKFAEQRILDNNKKDTPENNETNVENNPEKKLEKLKSLFDKQLISEQEYSAKKQEIISQL